MDDGRTIAEPTRTGSARLRWDLGVTRPRRRRFAIGGFPFELSMSKAEKQVYVSNLVGGPWELQAADYPNLKSVKAKINPTLGEWPLAVAPDKAL